MRTTATILSEFAGLNVQYIQRKSDNEYTSSCPYCGGSPHQNGEFPDRFIMLLKSNATGGPMGWCRNCGGKWHPGRSDQFTREQKLAWVKEREEIELRRKGEVEKALAFLRQEARWLEYNAALTEGAIAYYRARLISDYWIYYWKLGYVKNKTVNTPMGAWITPAFSIPIMAPETGDVVNIKYRLLNPPSPHDKYRPEYGLPMTMFVADHSKKIQGKTLLVEGEFKAMTTYITLDDADINVIGLPSKSPGQYVIDQLKDCDPIYLCLDPDADDSIIINKLGPGRVRTIKLADKIDDMIIKGYIGKTGVRALLNMARKVNNGQ